MPKSTALLPTRKSDEFEYDAGEMPVDAFESAPQAHELGYIDYLSPLASKAWGDTGTGLAACLLGLVIAGVAVMVRKRFTRRE
jgi:hypothetical protein